MSNIKTILNLSFELGLIKTCRITEMTAPLCETLQGTKCGFNKVLYFEFFLENDIDFDHSNIVDFFLTKEEYFMFKLDGHFDNFDIQYSDDFVKNLLQTGVN